MSYQDLTVEERFIYDWQHDMLGGFSSKLMAAIVAADMDNLNRLGAGFPIEVNGYINFTRIDGWWEKVQKKVSSK